MKTLALSLILITGCTDGPQGAPPANYAPMDDDVNPFLVETLEEYFGDRVGFEDIGEFNDGEHYSVIHQGVEYVVVWNGDRIVSVSKAGAL